MTKPKIKPIELILKLSSPIDLKLRLAARTEEKLRRYVKKQFNLSLEEKLMDVLKGWIGGAIENYREIEKIESKD